MIKRLLFSILVIVFASLVSADLTTSQIDEILELHNKERALLNDPPLINIPPLRWDTRLAQVAQNYAQKCVWAHNSDRSKEFNEMTGMTMSVGENLSLMTFGRGVGGWFSMTGDRAKVESMVKLWIDEKQHYNNRRCDSGQVCGHYTQMIWSTTTILGCGLTTCASLAGIKDADFLVCNYANAGNILGRSPY